MDSSYGSVLHCGLNMVMLLTKIHYCLGCVSSNTGSPSSPENLHVVNTDKGSVSLEWQPAKETVIIPVDGYVIEIAKGDNKDFTEVARVDSGTCKFDATGLKDGEMYNFRVKSLNQAGISTGSAQLDKPVIASAVGRGLHILIIY